MINFKVNETILWLELSAYRFVMFSLGIFVYEDEL